MHHPYSNSSNCTLSAQLWLIRVNFHFVSYYLLSPAFFVFGHFGHVLCVILLSKQARKDRAYEFQFYVEISETLGSLAFAIYALTIKWWSGAEGDGAVWYKKSYTLVWFAARLATPLVNICITISLLLSLSAAIDRTLPMYKPFLYNAWNQRAHRNCVLFMCLILGSGTSLFAIWRYRIHRLDSGWYQIEIDEEYASRTFVITLSNIRNLLRTLAVGVLIACNAAMIYAYRSYVRRKYINQYSNISDQLELERNLMRRKTKRMLTDVAIVESTTTAIGILALTAYFLLIFSRPDMTNCAGLLMIPVVDVVYQATNSLKFYIIIIASGRFRRILSELLVWRKVALKAK